MITSSRFPTPQPVASATARRDADAPREVAIRSGSGLVAGQELARRVVHGNVQVLVSRGGHLSWLPAERVVSAPSPE